MIGCRSVERGYPGGFMLKVDRFDACPGGLTALVGPNGAGKSTLLRLLAGLDHPDRGEVLLDGTPLAALPPGRLAREVACLLPDVRRRSGLAVLEAVLAGRVAFRASGLLESDRDERIALETMEELGIAHLAGRLTDTLSSGEFQRVMLAAILVKRPSVVLLDEPTAFLDVRHALESVRLLRRLAEGRRLAVVIVSHDLELAVRHADQAALMKAGRLIAAGPPGKVLRADGIGALFELPVAEVPGPDGRPLFLFGHDGHGRDRRNDDAT